MVDVKELRVGNWVDVGSNHQQWREYDYTDHLEIYRSEPIPLTPEILEKCGFERHQDGMSIQVGNLTYLDYDPDTKQISITP